MPSAEQLKHAFKAVLNDLAPHVLVDARRSFRNKSPDDQAIKGLPLEERLKLVKVLGDARAAP